MPPNQSGCQPWWMASGQATSSAPSEPIVPGAFGTRPQPNHVANQNAGPRFTLRRPVRSSGAPDRVPASRSRIFPWPSCRDRRHGSARCRMALPYLRGARGGCRWGISSCWQEARRNLDEVRRRRLHRELRLLGQRQESADQIVVVRFRDPEQTHLSRLGIGAFHIVDENVAFNFGRLRREAALPEQVGVSREPFHQYRQFLPFHQAVLHARNFALDSHPPALAVLDIARADFPIEFVAS